MHRQTASSSMPISRENKLYFLALSHVAARDSRQPWSSDHGSSDQPYEAGLKGDADAG